ncbi:MAG: hypothetical protein J6V63_04290 [Spirochaetaceae bacterium]|nr:hypothetical protein [Spirochaetaceae bacterium]
MLTAEYNFDTAMAVKQEEAYEEGISIGLERGAYQTKLETAKLLLSYGDSPEKVSICTKLPLENILQIQSSL